MLKKITIRMMPLLCKNKCKNRETKKTKIIFKNIQNRLKKTATKMKSSWRWSWIIIYKKEDWLIFRKNYGKKKPLIKFYKIHNNF